jgi:hypothetical protein
MQGAGGRTLLETRYLHARLLRAHTSSNRR